MKKSLASLEVCTLLLLCAFSATQSSKSWDYMVFAQQWSETSCIDEDIIKHGEHRCRVPTPVHSWAVHGVWPSQSGTKDLPAFCNKTWQFDENKIKSIENQLLEFWPNCYKDTSLTSFWIHEWTKHGTCATSDPAMKNELAYFSTGLKLAAKYNLTTWIDEAGIEPSNTTVIKLQTFYDIIIGKTGHRPIIECVWSHKMVNQFIGQVYMCLNKSFNPIECPKEATFRLSPWQRNLNLTSFQLCDDNKDVIYPEIYHDKKRYKTVL